MMVETTLEKILALFIRSIAFIIIFINFALFVAMIFFFYMTCFMLSAAVWNSFQLAY